MADIVDIRVRADTKAALANILAFNRSLTTTGATAAATGRLLAGLGAIAAGVFTSRIIGQVIEFEREMSNVESVVGGTADTMGRLTARAREMGRTTVFTANQAAQGMTLLAQSGFSADEVFRGINDTLTLAAAGSLELAEAASIAANVVNGFGLGIDGLNRVADVLAKGAANSNTTVRGLGDAFSYAAPIAQAFGANVEQAGAALGVLSDVGIRGQRAGVGLRAVFTRIVNVVPKAQRALDRLGVTVEDGNGGFRDLVSIFQDLDKAGASVTDVFQIFGKIGGSAAQAILEGVRSGDLQELENLLYGSAGAAQAMADVRLDNTAGDLRLLTSAFADLNIEILSQDGLSSIRNITRAGTAGIRELTAGIIALAGSGSIELLDVNEIRLDIIRIEADVLNFYDNLNELSFGLLDEFAGTSLMERLIFGGNAGVISLALSKVGLELKDIIDLYFDVIDSGAEAGNTIVDSIKESLGEFSAITLTDFANDVGDSIGDVFSDFGDDVSAFFDSINPRDTPTGFPSTTLSATVVQPDPVNIGMVGLDNLADTFVTISEAAGSANMATTILMETQRSFTELTLRTVENYETLTARQKVGLLALGDQIIVEQERRDLYRQIVGEAREGSKTQNTFIELLDNADDSVDALIERLIEFSPAVLAAAEAIAESQRITQQFEDIGDDIGASFKSATASGLMAALSGDQSIFEAFGTTLASGLQNAAINALDPVFDAVGDFFGGLLQAVIGGAVKGGVAAASGGIITGSSTGILRFQTGGIVPGLPSSGDSVGALLTPGEIVLNQSQQRNIAAGLGNGGTNVVNNNTYNMDISGNVDQRAIDQIQKVIMTSPRQVNDSQNDGNRQNRSITSTRR